MTPRRREGPIWNSKNQKFYFDSYVGFPPAHKRIRLSLRTRDPVKARWLWEQEYRRQWEKYYGGGSMPIAFSGSIYFDDAADDYVAYERDIKRVKEWLTVKHRLRIISEVWQGKMLNEITGNDFKALDVRLRAMGRSEATINHYVKTVRALYAWAIRKKLVKENPAKEIPFYVTPLKRRAYSTDEISRIIEAATRIEKEAEPGKEIMHHARQLIIMLLYTGMRTGEVVGLKWQNVNGEAIRLDRTETKQKKEKVVPLTAPVRIVLEELRAERKDDFVFPFRRRRGTFRPAYMDNLIRKIREYSGVADFVFHGLRHTAATIMMSEALGRGATLVDIMTLLGHSKFETAIRYQHADLSRMKKAMEILEEKFYKK